MSFFIAIVIVVVIGGLVAKLYPHKIQPTISPEETLTPKPEPVVESIPEVVIEPLTEAPKMAAKPKKKAPKKKPTDA